MQLALGEQGRYLAITDDSGSVNVIQTSGTAQAKKMKKKHSNVSPTADLIVFLSRRS